MEVAAMSQMDPRLFLAVAVSGERENPGLPACVWINAAEASAKYMPLNKISPEELKTGLVNMYNEDRDSFLFVNQTDTRVHVFKHSKADAMQSLSSAFSSK